jgi:hypothetical protein
MPQLLLSVQVRDWVPPEHALHALHVQLGVHVVGRIVHLTPVGPMPDMYCPAVQLWSVPMASAISALSMMPFSLASTLAQLALPSQLSPTT